MAGDEFCWCVHCVNPFTAPACKISWLKKHTYTPANSVFDGPITNLLSILCILIEILSRAHAKEEKSLNPFTAPACKISGLKDSRTHLQTAYFQCCNHLSSMLCVLMKIVSHRPVRKRRQKSWMVSNFALLFVVLKRHHGSEAVNDFSFGTFIGFSEWHAGKHGCKSITFTYCSYVISHSTVSCCCQSGEIQTSHGLRSHLKRLVVAVLPSHGRPAGHSSHNIND